MDKATSVLAAFDAGKFPDQKQVNQATDWVLVNLISEIEPQDVGELSAQGKAISNGLREVLQAYKQLGTNKNGRYCRFNYACIALTPKMGFILRRRYHPTSTLAPLGR
jgi:hypothetical protein